MITIMTIILTMSNGQSVLHYLDTHSAIRHLKRTTDAEDEREMALDDTLFFGALLQEFDPLVTNEVHVALQRLVVEDDADAESSGTTTGDEEQLLMSSAHENTDNDSEASTSAMSAASSSSRKRAPPVSSVAPESPTTPTTSDGDHKKRKLCKKSTYLVRKVR